MTRPYSASRMEHRAAMDRYKAIRAERQKERERLQQTQSRRSSTNSLAPDFEPLEESSTSRPRTVSNTSTSSQDTRASPPQKPSPAKQQTSGQKSNWISSSTDKLCRAKEQKALSERLLHEMEANLDDIVAQKGKKAAKAMLHRRKSNVLSWVDDVARLSALVCNEQSRDK